MASGWSAPRFEWVRLLLLAGVVFLAAYSIFFVVRVGAALAFPYPLLYGEGAVAATGQAWRAGIALYRDPALPPFLSANYGPLAYLPAFVVGDGAGLLAGRAASAAGALAIAAGLASLTRRRRPWRLALAGLWLALPPVYAWSAIAKPDLPALALAFWGLILAPRRPALAGCLIAAGALAKPTALFALVALAPAALDGFRRADRPARGCRATLLVSVGVLAAATLALEAASGRWFLQRTITLNLTAWTADQGLQALGNYARLYWPLTGGAIAIGLTRLAGRRPTRWDAYLAVSLIYLAVGVFKTGAFINYFLDPLIASLAVWASVLGSDTAPSTGPPLLDRIGRPARSMVAALAFLQLILSAHTPFRAEPLPTPTPADHERARAVIAAIAASGDPWLAEDSGWLVAAGRAVWIDDPFYFGQLARAGAWDGSILDTAIRDRRFSAVLLEFDPAGGRAPGFHADRFPDEAVRALIESYPARRSIGLFTILEPAPP